MGVFGLGIRLRLAQAGGPMLGLVLRTHLPKHNHHKIRFHFQLDQEVILEAVICCWDEYGAWKILSRTLSSTLTSQHKRTDQRIEKLFLIQ